LFCLFFSLEGLIILFLSTTPTRGSFSHFMTFGQDMTTETHSSVDCFDRLFSSSRETSTYFQSKNDFDFLSTDASFYDTAGETYVMPIDYGYTGDSNPVQMPPLEDATPVDIEDAFSDPHSSGSSSSSDSESTFSEKKISSARAFGDDTVKRSCSRFLSLVSSFLTGKRTTSGLSEGCDSEDDKDTSSPEFLDERRFESLRNLVKSEFNRDLCEAILAQITMTKKADDVSVGVLLSEFTETLSLRGCLKITDRTIDNVIRYCPNLKALDISDCGSLTQDKISSLLHSPVSKTIEELHMNGIRWLTDRSVSSVFGPVLPSLRVLTLRRCIELKDTGITVLPSLCPLLIHLDISGCGRITSKGIRSLSSALAARRKTSTEDKEMCLRLRRCGGVNDSVVAGIASSLGDVLEYLDVSHCEDITDASVTALAAQCSRLRRLNLRGCFRVKDTGVLSFANNDSAPRRTLEYISLDKCDIGDETVELLVARCPHLRHLSVVDCPRLTRDRMVRLAKCTGAEIEL